LGVDCSIDDGLQQASSLVGIAEEKQHGEYGITGELVLKVVLFSAKPNRYGDSVMMPSDLYLL